MSTNDDTKGYHSKSEMRRLEAMKESDDLLTDQKVLKEKLAQKDLELDQFRAEVEFSSHLRRLFEEWEKLLGPMPGLRIRELLRERDQLKAWKKEALAIARPMLDFKHPEMRLGESKVDFIIKLAKERDRYKAALEKVATYRCEWPVSQGIAREALEGK